MMKSVSFIDNKEIIIWQRQSHFQVSRKVQAYFNFPCHVTSEYISCRSSWEELEAVNLLWTNDFREDTVTRSLSFELETGKRLVSQYVIGNFAFMGFLHVLLFCESRHGWSILSRDNGDKHSFSWRLFFSREQGTSPSIYTELVRFLTKLSLLLPLNSIDWNSGNHCSNSSTAS